jgi:DNA modification methylase
MMPTWKSRDGSAVLYLGDCLKVLPGLRAGCAHMVMTDPPFGHGNNDGDLIANWEAALGWGRAGPPRPMVADRAEADPLFRAALAEFPRLLAAGGCCCCCCCCCGGGGPDPQFARWSLWLDEALEFKQMIIWDKGPMGLGWHYRRSCESILVAQKRGAKCRWFDTSGKIENIIRPSSYIRKIIPRADEHPTAKPPRLGGHFIRLHTRRGDTVLDPFMGAGPFGVAAIRAGRKFIGVEIEKRWFDAAREWIAETISHRRRSTSASASGTAGRHTSGTSP